MTAGEPAAAPFYEYAAYHFAIRSEIELPGLPAAGDGETFEIRLTPLIEPLNHRTISWHEEPTHEACFDYPGLAQFVVRDGHELIIAADPGGDATILPLYVQGMMLAAGLCQCGFFVLHASVVDLGGYAIALAGPVGAGKSTLATALHARGHRILADDNAALELESALPLVLPGFPVLKVYPEIARSLGFEPSSLQLMHQSQVKRAHSVQDAFCPISLPLRGIYILDRDAEAVPSRIGPAECIAELIRHSVPTRWEVPGNARHLRSCARLARTVPLFRVRTFRSLPEIPAIAAAIQCHAGAQAST